MRWLDGERGGGWGGGSDVAAMGRVRWCVEGDRCVERGCDVDEGRRRGTCLSVDSHLRWGGAGFKPAPLDPRRRIAMAGAAPARQLRRAAGASATAARGDALPGERRAARVRALAAAHAAPSHSRAHLLTRAVRARVQVPHRGRGPAERRGDGTRWRRSEGRGGGGGRRATGRSEVERGGGVARAEAEAKRGAEAAEARTEAGASGGGEGTRGIRCGRRRGRRGEGARGRPSKS